VSNAPVEEWIKSWNVDKKQYTEVEYVAVNRKQLIMSYNSGFCLVDVQASVVYFAIARLSACLRRKMRQAQGRNWKPKWI
jgi:hypothetical protein